MKHSRTWRRVPTAHKSPTTESRCWSTQPFDVQMASNRQTSDTNVGIRIRYLKLVPNQQTPAVLISPYFNNNPTTLQFLPTLSFLLNEVMHWWSTARMDMLAFRRGFFDCRDPVDGCRMLCRNVRNYLLNYKNSYREKASSCTKCVLVQSSGKGNERSRLQLSTVCRTQFVMLSRATEQLRKLIRAELKVISIKRVII
jgi:hypothetical protein